METGSFQGRSEVLRSAGFLATLPAARLAALCVPTKLAPFPLRLGSKAAMQEPSRASRSAWEEKPRPGALHMRLQEGLRRF